MIQANWVNTVCAMYLIFEIMFSLSIFCTIIECIQYFTKELKLFCIHAVLNTARRRYKIRVTIKTLCSLKRVANFLNIWNWISRAYYLVETRQILVETDVKMYAAAKADLNHDHRRLGHRKWPKSVKRE